VRRRLGGPRTHRHRRHGRPDHGSDLQPDATSSPTPGASTRRATRSSSPTCEQLVAKGWSFKETPFAAGGVTLDDGLQCTWADFTKPSGNLLLFGWAPLTGDQATKIQNALEQQGWKRRAKATTST
jgi:hypothetical protein